MSVAVTAVFLIPHSGFGESGSSQPPRGASFLDGAWLHDPRPAVYQPPATSPEQLLRQLYEVQAQTLSILRKAESLGDLPTALAAAWQARANIELISEFRTQTRTGTEFRLSSPILALAFKDGSIRAVRAYWIEGESLHMINMQGGSEKMSADLLDRELTLKLDRSQRQGGS